MKKKKFVDTLGKADTQSTGGKPLPWYERLSDKNVANVGKSLFGKVKDIAKSSIVADQKTNPVPIVEAMEADSISSILTPNQKKYATLSPIEFGIMLKKKRKELHWEHTDVSRELKFRESFIDALENGRYYLLPDQYFIRGLIGQYSQLLQIEEDIYLAFLAQHFYDEMAIKRLLKMNDIAHAPSRFFNRDKEYVKKKFNYHPTHLMDLIKPIGLLVVLGLLFGGYYLFLSIGEKNHFMSPESDAPAAQFMLHANENTPIKLTATNGTVLLETVIQKGQTINLPAQKDTKLTTPAVANLTFLLNDKSYRYTTTSAGPYILDMDSEKLLPLLTLVPAPASKKLPADSLDASPDTLSEDVISNDPIAPKPQ